MGRRGIEAERRDMGREERGGRWEIWREGREGVYRGEGRDGEIWGEGG